LLFFTKKAVISACGAGLRLILHIVVEYRQSLVPYRLAIAHHSIYPLTMRFFAIRA
jgi:hypothetical protein